MAGMQGKLSNNKKRQIQTLIFQATQACTNGRFDACEQLCRRIESLFPNHPNAANLRGIMCSQSGQPDAAIDWLRKAIKAAPNKGEYHVNLGNVYLEQKRYKEAASSYRQAVTLGNKTLRIELNHTKALIESGQFKQALQILERLNKQHPQDTDVLMGLFLASDPLSLAQHAEGYLEQILAINPDHAEAHAKKGQLATQQGRMADAESQARRLISILPDSPRAYEILTYAKRYDDPNDPDIVAMMNLYEQSEPGSESRQAMCFMLGRVMEQVKLFDRAFAYFTEGNAIRHEKSIYNYAYELSHLEETVSAYTSDAFSNISDCEDATPVFIIGLPRCGSTLVEQILAAHPDVASRGECDCFASDVLAGLHSAENPLTLKRLTSFTPKQWGEVGRDYVKHLRNGDTTSLRITDKTLTNTKMVGALHCALPNAKIVHIRRNPLDNCLSIYKVDLEGVLFDYAYSLKDLGDYYRLYLQLMQHWRDVLPPGAMYELDYENLVSNQETETRKLLEYCELTWNDACLQFNKAKNTVRTASMAQVRRGIYTDSMAAWKRYEKHLQPLIDILGPEHSTQDQTREH